jgi:hypothetical protein
MDCCKFTNVITNQEEFEDTKGVIRIGKYTKDKLKIEHKPH